MEINWMLCGHTGGEDSCWRNRRFVACRSIALLQRSSPVFNSAPAFASQVGGERSRGWPQSNQRKERTETYPSGTRTTAASSADSTPTTTSGRVGTSTRESARERVVAPTWGLTAIDDDWC